MRFILLAQSNSDGGTPGIAMFIGGAVLLLVLWWLYRIGFFGRFLGACRKSAVVMIGGGIAIAVISSFVGKASELGEMISANAQGSFIFFGLVFLGTTVYFYRKSPRLRSPNRDDPEPTEEEKDEESGRSAPSSSGHCHKCKGTGEVTGTCQSCGGAGETRCAFQETADNWFSSGSTVLAQCTGGVVQYGGGLEKYCSSCNGRGFNRCSGCAGSGRVTVTCKKCNGAG
jgi:hypothetical protein